MGMGKRFGWEEAGFGLEPKEIRLFPCLKPPEEETLKTLLYFSPSSLSYLIDIVNILCLT